MPEAEAAQSLGWSAAKYPGDGKRRREGCTAEGEPTAWDYKMVLCLKAWGCLFTGTSGTVVVVGVQRLFAIEGWRSSLQPQWSSAE